MTITTALAACGTPAPAPSGAPVEVHAVTPARGGLPGGTTIVIDGQGFASADGRPPTVILGRTAATEVGVVDDYTLTATTPRGENAGDVDVIVSDSGGYGRLDRGFAYNPLPAVTAIAPARGPTAGGTPITITGSGFLDLDAGPPALRLGDLAPTDVTVVSDTEITATTPPGPPFQGVDVTVENRNGTSTPLVTPVRFTYTAKGLLVGASRSGPPYGLFYFDPDTGLATRIFAMAADPWASNGMHSLAADHQGVVWGTTHPWSQPAQLFWLDPYRGEVVAKGPLVDPSTGSGVDCRDLEVAGSTLYCVQYGVIYSIDTLTMHATRIAQVTSNYRFSLVTVGDTTYALTGGQCCNPSTLTPIDLATGTLGTPIPLTLAGQPLATGSSKATAYQGAVYFIGSSWWGPDANPGQSRAVYRVDVTTGAATLVGKVPFQTTSLTSLEGDPP